MNTEAIKEAVDTGRLYAADVTPDSAFVYFEPSTPRIEHEHAAHYLKKDGTWQFETGLYGDLLSALGGVEYESEALKAIGLHDDLAANTTTNI